MPIRTTEMASWGSSWCSVYGLRRTNTVERVQQLAESDEVLSLFRPAAFHHTVLIFLLRIGNIRHHDLAICGVDVHEHEHDTPVWELGDDRLSIEPCA